MADSDKNTNKGGFTLDWLVGGALSRIGETVDRVTGRGWNPSSSLATSKLSEKLCFLLDEEARDGGNGGKFAPHIITLKMQWNKFSSDADEDLERLRDELHAAAIDHINDKLYHTYAPFEIEIKTDYFTEGVRITGSFGEFGSDDEEAAVNVTLPEIKVERTSEGSRASINLVEDAVVEKPAAQVCVLRFSINGKPFEKKLDFSRTKRFTVGRGKENAISIEHSSVSKVHASLVLGSDGKLMVADTGSTNGTYISEKRIAYGKAAEIGMGETLRFGAIRVEIDMPSSAAPGVPGEKTDVLESPTDVVIPPTVAFEADSVAAPSPAVPEDAFSESGEVVPEEITEADGDNADLDDDPKSREDWEI